MACAIGVCGYEFQPFRHENMEKQKIIVAGIDFSDSSPMVIRHGLARAKSGATRLLAVHVLDKSRLEHRKASGIGSETQNELKASAERKFEALLRGKTEGVEVEFVVKIGKPAEELCQVVTDSGASVLIISANDMTKARLGSIAARCVRMAACDVLVLRDWQGGDFKKIVVCTDFSDTADQAVERAAEIARRDGSILEIVHVMYPPGSDAWGEVLEHAAAAPSTYVEECRARVEGQMKSYVERHGAALAGVRFETLVLESEMPSVAITTHVKFSGADLVVMGTRGHSPIASYFLGTNAERLLHDASVSVLAVR